MRADDCEIDNTRSTSAQPQLKTVLIVEDNPDIRELLGMAIRRDGYDVCEAENGRDALDQLDTMSTPPCVLLLDLMMPIMSGQELLHILEETHRLDSLPVVVLSAGGQPPRVAGSTRFLRKPADPRRVLALVHELCGDP